MNDEVISLKKSVNPLLWREVGGEVVKNLLLILLVIASSCTTQEEASQVRQGNSPLIKANQSGGEQTTLPFTAAVSTALIKKGEYVPLYGSNKGTVSVSDFEMDVYPVTNKQYAAFVKRFPQWQKSSIKKIFADANYLHSWAGDTTLGESMTPNASVTNVSWFAAKAYCACVGKRLPTLDEWEYVAMADETTADARTKKSFNQYILDWYEKPGTFKNEIGKTYKNYWGVYDTHGLVWEWTSDFNSVMISGESRNEGKDNALFCGSGSIGAKDLMNYAALMRYAFRGSLKANYAVQNLGFRCVKNSKP